MNSKKGLFQRYSTEVNSGVRATQNQTQVQIWPISQHEPSSEGDHWVVNGQKIWTSLAQYSDWIFVLCRTSAEDTRHQGLSYLLVPMKQEEIEIRPIVQITGGSEFNEVFFNNAKTDRNLAVGEPGGGWSVAMGTLAFERGASTLGQQTSFSQELDELLQLAKQLGVIEEPVIRQKLMKIFSELQIMRYNQMRMLSSGQRRSARTRDVDRKLYWASWHRRLGELALNIRGASGMIGMDPTPPLENPLDMDTYWTLCNELSCTVGPTLFMLAPTKSKEILLARGYWVYLGSQGVLIEAT